MARNPRPPLYPVQLVVSVSTELAERVAADAGAREDKSKSAAARRLLTLGAMLADALDAGTLDAMQQSTPNLAEGDAFDDLVEAAKAVR